MKSECTNPDTGLLLHAYELDILTDAEKERFEEHLLSCDYCFTQLKEFAPTGKFLTSAPELAEATSSEKSPESLKSMTQLLWNNELPLILRPALLAVVIILLIYPAYLGLFTNDSHISSVQEIGLVQTRSGGQLHFTVQPGKDLVVSFRCPFDSLETSYAVTLFNREGKQLFTDSNYHEVDKYGFGKILIPGSLVKLSSYHLKVTTTTPDKADSILLEYPFTLTK